jgi:hypothetical protein
MAYYWNGTTFPGHSDKPVFITQEQFEDCCCGETCADFGDECVAWHAWVVGPVTGCVDRTYYQTLCEDWCPDVVGPEYEYCGVTCNLEPDPWTPGGYYATYECCCRELGACCRGTSCTMETQSACEEGGGVWDGSPGCDPNPCTATQCSDFGATCEYDSQQVTHAYPDTCASIMESAILMCQDRCQNAGPYEREYCGTVCIEATPEEFGYVECCCIEMGACCNGSDCTQATEAACIAGGGTYKGDGTDCDPNPCLLTDCPGSCFRQNSFSGFLSCEQGINFLKSLYGDPPTYCGFFSHTNTNCASTEFYCFLEPSGTRYTVGWCCQLL